VIGASKGREGSEEREGFAVVAGFALFAAFATFAAPASPGQGLTAPTAIAAVYDDVLAARFDAAAGLLTRTCPPAPQPACAALAAASLWWQILIDPARRALDEPLKRATDNAITAAEAWAAREPQRGEAWFLAAAARAPRVNLLALRGERLAAAREGRQIKDALERALEQDPSLDDAYFGIGLYHYYAAVAPLYARLLRWLLALPGGDRTRGLEEMMRARDRGAILGGEADFQLQQIYLWYEGRPRDALALLESLDARYPSNPLFLERIADVFDVYLHDREASAAAWLRLRDRARAGRVFDAARVEQRADARARIARGRFF